MAWSDCTKRRSHPTPARQNNRLRGPIPAELGLLTSLTRVELYRNFLSGAIPAKLADLTALEYLFLHGNRLEGAVPAGLASLGSLRELRLDDNRLSGAIPKALGPNLEWLVLSYNRFTGAIPPELAEATKLRYLNLTYNRLTGSIPAELAGLSKLDLLSLALNDLTGSIPAQLGTMSSLRYLGLSGNDLTGSIPPELGTLSHLENLYLSDNGLTGPIPAELSTLSRLRELHLSGNPLGGELPPQLGNLGALWNLSLSDAQLEGQVPPEFGGLTALGIMDLTDNPSLSGPLPDSLTALGKMRTLATRGTDLCAPDDADFRTWLAGIYQQAVLTCVEPGWSGAYLTQAVQSRSWPVPLVAGDSALLRVFVTSPAETSENIPGVRARFYLNGAETHVVDIPAGTKTIPAEADESDLEASANAVIPGNVIQPGLEMVIEVDPDSLVDSSTVIVRRIPETGTSEVDVRAVPALDLTVVPFLYTQDPDSSVIETTEAMADDPENHGLLHLARTLLPIGGLNVTAHEPVETSTRSAYQLLTQTHALWVAEGSAGYHMGMIAPRPLWASGLAYPGKQVSVVGTTDSVAVAHELGHNMTLSHARCGTRSFLDLAYPHSGGEIGAWGYDMAADSLIPNTTRDVMSYCRPVWISDYHFSKAVTYRAEEEGASSTVAMARRAPSLLVWGGIDQEGALQLEPAFYIEAPPALPRSNGGEYELAGRRSDGRTAFSIRFDLDEVADGEGGERGFAFAVPVDASWSGRLAAITLSGPGGIAVLDENTDKPMVILRNPRSGQIRGFLRQLPAVVQADGAGAAQATGERRGLDSFFSRGIPERPSGER